METVDCRNMSFNLSQEFRKQLSMAYWLVIWASGMSISSQANTEINKAGRLAFYRAVFGR